MTFSARYKAADGTLSEYLTTKIASEFSSWPEKPGRIPEPGRIPWNGPAWKFAEKVKRDYKAGKIPGTSLDDAGKREAEKYSFRGRPLSWKSARNSYEAHKGKLKGTPR